MSVTDHAKERLAERYDGLVLTEAQWTDGIASIELSRAGLAMTAMMLALVRENFERWTLRLAGVPVRLIYDPRRQLVVTVEPVKARKRLHFSKSQSERGRGRREGRVPVGGWED